MALPTSNIMQATPQSVIKAEVVDDVMVVAWVSWCPQGHGGRGPALMAGVP